MTSRAEPKVLTAGQICLGERAWSAAKWMVAAQPRTFWYLSCLPWKTFFVAPTAPSRTDGLARYPYDERGGAESTHLNAQSRPFCAPAMGSGRPRRSTMVTRRVARIAAEFIGSVGRRGRRRCVRGLFNARYTGGTGERRVGGSHASEGQRGMEG